MAYGQSVTAALLRARADLRARRRSWAALTLLIGLGAGAVIGAVAAGRRTDTAYPRFVAAHRAGDVVLYPPFGPQFSPVDFDAAARLPQVALTGRAFFVPLAESDIALTAPADDAYGRLIDRPKLLHGRMPRPDELGVAAVPYTVASSRRLHVGSLLAVHVTTLQLGNDSAPGPPPLRLPLRIVGIEASPGEFPPLNALNGGAGVHISRAQAVRLSTTYGAFEELVARLHRGNADVTAFETGLNHLTDGRPQLDSSYAPQAANVQRSLHLQAVALWVLGGLLGIVLLLVSGQLLARQSFLESPDNATLAALGMTADQLWAVGMARAAAVGLGAAVVAAVTTLAASPFTAVGTARIAEPHPGFALDAIALGPGAIAVLVAVVALAALPTWRLSRSVSRSDVLDESPRSALSTILGPGALTPTADVGVRMALQPGRGRSAVPVRSSLVAVAVAVAALVGALTFGASLSHLLDTPRLYGSSWDAAVSTSTADSIDAAVPPMAADRRVSAIAIADTGVPLAVNDQRVDGLVLKPVRGVLEPTVIKGRAPTAPGELLLGTKTLRRLHRNVGDEVEVRITAVRPNPVRFRIVASGVLPPTSDAGQLGEGAYLTYSGEERLAPPGITIPPAGSAFVRFAPGVDQQVGIAAVTKDAGPGYYAIPPPKPTDVVNFGRVESLPVLTAVLLGALAIATLAHTLLTSVQRRQRDLAVLKTLGFLPAQVRGAVAWQASSFCAVALLIGIPVGVATGRWTWDMLAHQLGTLPEPAVPPVALLVIVPTAIVVANLVAAWPARLAGRVRPAIALRTE
jgi:hypothetical protein